MRALFKSAIVAAAAFIVVSCGGGGGGNGSGEAFTPAGLTVSVSPATTSSTPNSLVPVTVRITGSNGRVLPDGTQVRLQASPSGLALVSSTQTPTGTPPNAGGSATLSDSTTGILSGGVANFRLHTRSVGSVTLTASFTDTAAAGATYTGSSVVSVIAGPSSDYRLVVEPSTTTLPFNPGVTPFLGSPYISEVAVTWRNLDGTLVTARTDSDTVGVAVNHIGNTQRGVVAISVDDDPTTTSVNEFTNLLTQGPVEVVAGRTRFYVHSLPFPGDSVVTVSVIDQLTGETITTQLNYRVTNGTAQLPGSIVIGMDDVPVYIQGVNGEQSKAFEVAVYDGAASFVPNPSTGVNNVRLEIVGGAQGGERLLGLNAAGASNQGSTISLRTNNGIANASYQSGSSSRLVTIRATTDRADNNVDNGIADPVTSTRQLAVSDGKLFDLDIATPVDVSASTAVTAPARGRDEYQMTITAVATDRFGNPPAPGTQIRFGLIDEPQVSRVFSIAGTDGDPQEGGLQFNAPGGAFMTAGGGAGPSDTLIVFGEESVGNRDLESARAIQSVNSQTNLTVTQRFNYNDDTGASVNNGPVLRYVIGHATDGNIAVTAQTNASGVVRSTVTYPRAKLGKRMVIWAQGVGDLVAGTPEIITDAEELSFQGSGPMTISAPSAVPPNQTVPVRVCVRDSASAGLQGVTIRYTLSTRQATVNGSSAGAGTISPPTGADGCVTVQVGSFGVTSSSTVGTITWAVDDAQATTDISGISGGLLLTANPSSEVVGGGSSSRTIELTVLQGAAGLGVPGVLLSGTCTATGGATLSISGAIPATNASGVSTATVSYSNFVIDPDGAGPTPPTLNTGSCTFTTVTGGATTTVNFVGSRSCGDMLSPPPPGC